MSLEQAKINKNWGLLQWKSNKTFQKSLFIEKSCWTYSIILSVISSTAAFLNLIGQPILTVITVNHALDLGFQSGTWIHFSRVQTQFNPSTYGSIPVNRHPIQSLDEANPCPTLCHSRFLMTCCHNSSDFWGFLLKNTQHLVITILVEVWTTTMLNAVSLAQINIINNAQHTTKQSLNSITKTL